MPNKKDTLKSLYERDGDMCHYCGIQEEDFLELWETVVPLLMELHPEYVRCTQAQEIYHNMKILVYLRDES